MSRIEINYQTISHRIKQTRLEKNLTQEFLADTVNVNPSHISNIENHRTKVSLDTLVNLANAMEVTVDYLLSDEYISPDTALETTILIETRKLTTRDKERLIKIIRALQE